MITLQKRSRTRILNMTGTRTWVLGACLAALLSLGGCASEPESTRYYLLTDPTASQGRSSAQRPLSQLALGSVSLPVYLQSRNIAVVIGNTEIRGARAHRWAEPLGDALQRYLRETLASGYQGEAPYLLDLTVHHLHGAESGAVLFDANWRVRARGSADVLHGGQFVERVQQSGAGYDALVEAHRQVLDRFADQVAAAVAGGAGGVANQKHSAPISDAPAIMEKPSS